MTRAQGAFVLWLALLGQKDGAEHLEQFPYLKPAMPRPVVQNPKLYLRLEHGEEARPCCVGAPGLLRQDSASCTKRVMVDQSVGRKGALPLR
jgi:hypothetical protein